MSVVALIVRTSSCEWSDCLREAVEGSTKLNATRSVAVLRCRGAVTCVTEGCRWSAVVYDCDSVAYC